MKANVLRKTLCAAFAFSCLTAVPALAAETSEEYKEEAAAIESEISSVEEEIKALREENGAVADRYREVKEARKTEGTLSVSEENWEKARELRKQIGDVKEASGRKTSMKEQKDTIKNAVKSGDYDAALEAKNALLESRRDMLEPLTEMNEIWQQIDGLLQ